jgi:HEAT repeat protein
LRLERTMPQTTVRPVNEALLATDVCELAHDFVRDFAMACKKAGIYGPNHPVVVKAVEKPFFSLNAFFRFKRYVHINIESGNLHVLHFRLRESAFVDEVLQYCQVADVNNLIFERNISVTDLREFLAQLVTRQAGSQRGLYLHEYLQSKGISSIQVNSELAVRMFEAAAPYRGEIVKDAGIKRIVFDLLGDDLARLSEIFRADENELLRLGIDYDADIVQYVLPERIASLPEASVNNALEDSLAGIRAAHSEDEQSEKQQSYTDLVAITQFHPSHSALFERQRQLSSGSPVADMLADTQKGLLNASGPGSGQQINEIMNTAQTTPAKAAGAADFRAAFDRLIRTGRHVHAENTINRLLDMLGSSTIEYRSIGLQYMTEAVACLDPENAAPVIQNTVTAVATRITRKEETYEYAEVLSCLIEKLVVTRSYEILAGLLKAMSKRRHIDGKLVIYDSMAVKRAFETINRRNTLDAFVSDLIQCDIRQAGYIRDILIATASEEAALALSNVISHPSRQVRQQTLKILAELGKASLKVFSEILADDSMFEREGGRHELPDSKWYIIRNSIFVLGSIRDPEGVSPLRLRFNDKDVRVRREIVSALDKIGGEDALDLLIMMAGDTEKEIYEAAIIAIGLCGTPDVAPLLIDIARRNPSATIKAVSALAKLGGEAVREFLSSLLADEEKLTQFSQGRVSRDDLRLAIVRALGSLGDAKAIEQLKKYQDSLTTTQKIFFKNSPVNKAVSDSLSRKQ